MGFVLDGVATTSGASPDKFPYVSSGRVAFDEVGDEVLALCAKDSVCSSRFKKKGIQATIEHLFAKLDKNPESTCAKLLKTVKNGQDEDPPSFALRYVLGSLLLGSSTRSFIPPIVYRLLRCAAKDVKVLEYFIAALNEGIATAKIGDSSISPVLESLILFSEIWESPAPSISTLKKQFAATSANTAISYLQTPLYCASSKEKSPTCNKLKVGTYEGNGVTYERDEYWNKAAKIPDQASVLIMGSKLDSITPSTNAEYLLEALDGDNKELITFDYTYRRKIWPV